MDITGFSLDGECRREIKEFSFYHRLEPVDYGSIIAQGDAWRDPHFKPAVNSLVDETMMRNNRIT